MKLKEPKWMKQSRSNTMRSNQHNCSIWYIFYAIGWSFRFTIWENWYKDKIGHSHCWFEKENVGRVILLSFGMRWNDIFVTFFLFCLLATTRVHQWKNLIPLSKFLHFPYRFGTVDGSPSLLFKWVGASNSTVQPFRFKYETMLMAVYHYAMGHIV